MQLQAVVSAGWQERNPPEELLKGHVVQERAATLHLLTARSARHPFCYPPLSINLKDIAHIDQCDGQ